MFDDLQTHVWCRWYSGQSVWKAQEFMSGIPCLRHLARIDWAVDSVGDGPVEQVAAHTVMIFRESGKSGTP